jgi:hypothetical protein
VEHVSETLEALSDAGTAKAASKQTTSLRGIRGVPTSEIARVADAAWREDPPVLAEVGDELDALFGAAWEDGLVAIGLLATCWSDAPVDAFDRALDWAERLDDSASADALGWLVLGPIAAVLDDADALQHRLRHHHRDAVRRCGLMAAMAWTPTTLEGPAAAPLRAKHNNKKLRMVEAARSDLLAPHLHAWLRDESPSVRKAMRRILRAWANDDPAAVVAWGEAAGGGLPKLLRPEVKRAQRALNAADEG